MKRGLGRRLSETIKIYIPHYFYKGTKSYIIGMIKQHIRDRHDKTRSPPRKPDWDFKTTYFISDVIILDANDDSEQIP